MRTYVIEPQLVFVPFLERMLAAAGIQVVATSAEVDERDIAAHAPAAILVDVDFFERGAANALCRIRQAARYAAVIALSDIDDATFAASCYISGASAVCSKREGLEKILGALRSALGVERGSAAAPVL